MENNLDTNSMKKLTTAEEQVMQILWSREKGFVKDILEDFPEPKPAYNTVSTIIRILEKKGFVGHKAFGKTHEYFSLIDKKDYARNHFRSFVKDYFENSFSDVVSFLVKDKDMSITDLEEVLNEIKKK